MRRLRRVRPAVWVVCGIVVAMLIGSLVIDLSRPAPVNTATRTASGATIAQRRPTTAASAKTSPAITAPATTAATTAVPSNAAVVAAQWVQLAYSYSWQRPLGAWQAAAQRLGTPSAQAQLLRAWSLPTIGMLFDSHTIQTATPTRATTRPSGRGADSVRVDVTQVSTSAAGNFVLHLVVACQLVQDGGQWLVANWSQIAAY